jgi:hypothetical protein
MKPKETNSDPDIDPEEIDAAAQEQVDPGVEPEPEISPRTQNLTEWDAPPGSAGRTAPKVRPDDENAVGQELVQDGVESADRDQRLAAADPDYEA